MNLYVLIWKSIRDILSSGEKQVSGQNDDMILYFKERKKIAWKKHFFKNSENLAGQISKCRKHSLEEHSGRSNMKMGSKDCSHEVSEGERPSSELGLKVFMLNSIKK